MAAITNVRLGLWIEHPERMDLSGYLTAPDGTQIDLFGGQGGQNPDIGSGPTDAELCIFDDDAAGLFSDIPSGTGDGYPGDSTGSFQPYLPLSGLDGLEGIGVWKLMLVDPFIEDPTGTLKNVSLWVDTATDSYRVDLAPDAALTPQDLEGSVNPAVDGIRFEMTVGTPPVPAGLEWHITGLWLPDATSVPYYGRVADPFSSRVDIPLNDSRRATLTASIQDTIVGDVVDNTYARCLQAYYRGVLVFWGPVNLADVDMEAGTITLSAVDPSLRLMHHYLRRGDLDGTLNAANSDMSTVSVDHVGMRLVRDAANTITGPMVGIIDGINTFDDAPDSLMGVSRGDNVWETMQQIAASLGPDFELEPLDTTDGAYARLNTYTRQGTDKSDTVQFHYGTGRQNVQALTFTTGSKLTTLVHVISRDGRRVTSANSSSIADVGQYIDWDAVDYDAKRVTDAAADAVLAAYGHEIIAAYGRPLLTVDLTLPFEDDTSYRYHHDYKVGDTVSVAGRAGAVNLPEADYRIVSVALEQPDSTGDIRPTLQVVADMTGSSGDTIITATEDDV